LACTPHGKWLASGSTDGLVHVWDAHSLTETASLRPSPVPRDADNPDHMVQVLAFTPDGKTLAVGGTTTWASDVRGGCAWLELWDLSDRPPELRVARRWPLLSNGRGGLDGESVNELAFSADGKTLAALLSEKGIWLWNWDGSTLEEKPGPLPGGDWP